MASRFRFTSADGTRVWGWRNDHDGVPVVISNGLGTPPEVWPTIIDDPRLRVCTWYYRGTMGDDRPADTSRVTVDDHVADLVALLDHEGIERALVPAWSLGVNVAFELARLHPERVAGILAVAGVPGGTFRSVGVVPHLLPAAVRHALGVAGVHAMRLAGPALNLVARSVPLNRATATVLNHSGFVLPTARSDRLLPALEEFRRHDFRWYFTLAAGATGHAPMDLSFVEVPVTIVAGRWDAITSWRAMERAARQIPHAELHVLPGSHFLPLEQPELLHDELLALAERTELTTVTWAPGRTAARKR